MGQHIKPSSPATFGRTPPQRTRARGAPHTKKDDGRPGPTRAWCDEVFGKPEAIDVAKQGTTTTRHPVMMERAKRIIYAWGGYERTALLLLEHLWRMKHVTRWKSQPFNLADLGGPRAVPDILVELPDRGMHVIQVRAKRFLTEEVQHKYAIEREFLEARGFHYHVWTNHDVLSSRTSHTVAELDRGRMFRAPQQTIEDIGQASRSATQLGDLVDQFGWDDTLSAAALLAFHLDITEPLHDQSPILRNPSPFHYRHLFESRDAAQAWWEALDDAVPI